MRSVAGLLALSLCVACDPTRPATPLDDPGDYTSVHAVLFAGSDEARVLVTRIRPLLLPIAPGRAVPVTGARVTLRGDGRAWTLVTAADTVDRCTSMTLSLAAGCYIATIPGGIRAEARYTLDIVLPDGDIVTGETTVPGEPHIVTPTGKPTFLTTVTDTGYVERPFTELSWTGTEANAFIEVSAAANRPDCTVRMNPEDRYSSSGVDRIRVTGDRVSLRMESVQCREPIDVRTWDATLRVTRFGDEYARRFAVGFDTADPDSMSFGLHGAIGIFTGAASTTLPVTIIQP